MSEKTSESTREELEAELTKQQIMFCINYVGRFNAANAAREAGYSAECAREQGYRLLTKDHIRAYVNFLAKNLVTDAEIGVERILRELARRAFYRPGDLYDENGKEIHPKDLPDGVAAAVEGYEIDVIGRSGSGEDAENIVRIKYKMASSDKALEQLGRYHKMFTDNLNHSGKLTLEDLVAGTDDE